MDFFNLLSEEFNMNKVFISKGDFLIEFKKFLLESFVSEKSVLLIIDEAQRLNHELLEQIRLLSNIELDNRKLLNIFFVGQSEFNQLIRDGRNRAFRQRISVNYQLEPLSKPETAKYIQHRLSRAGATQEIFKTNAVREVFNFSRGYPRLINVICDYALVTGYSQGLKKIGAGVVKDCAKDLEIPTDVAKIPKRPSAPGEDQRKLNLAAVQQKEQSNVRAGFIFICFIFCLFVGYQIYDSLAERSPLWQQEDYAPQKNIAFSEKGFEVLDAETEKEEEIAKVEPLEVHPLREEEETQNSAEVPMNDEENSSDEAFINDRSDALITDSVSDQRSIIYFDHNSNELPQIAYETLNNIIKMTSQHPDLKITVEGFTDSRGDPVYNKQLSKYRADMVKNYLIGQGISASRIDVFGRGAQNPLKSNTSFEGRKQNRRVEIKVSDTQE
jgi:general secretion pathway protein A